ncbi:esterase/lipase family protein [Paraburkholderia adhaesiva]|uniref:esterase/lipase family protein n=1 Tax=Paraburkholderia adhaesiva TaxID=2883244 RepID=UPI001F255A23|nr:alpha/beta fold hydrolase [Paraburkholderia adhaesiva]
MKYPHAVRRLRLASAALALMLLSGCATLREFGPSVEVQTMDAGEYITLKRGDILTRGSLSDATAQTLRVAGLDEGACEKASSLPCVEGLSALTRLAEDRRLSAVSELWMLRASEAKTTDERMVAWLEATRFAYAYLFFSSRRPGDRAFEDRQTQVRDWYNYAAQQASVTLFDRSRQEGSQPVEDHVTRVAGGWTLHIDSRGVRLPAGASMPAELLPAASLSFRGLRSLYRHDGLGAELVAVMEDAPLTAAPTPKGRPVTGERPPVPWSEMPTPSMTVLLRPAGASLEAVLATKEMTLSAHDPYLEDAVDWQGQRVPLAANYTAGYGLWLARSGFSRQSLRSLFGHEGGIDRPHIYLMQPYDPNRRIIVMLHGLASSPEAWVNLANEIMGDEELRKQYQIWQVYYPTNVPIVINHAMIRRALDQTLAHFDPSRQAPASKGLVLVGHSMGGVISRLMVSSADQQLVQWAQKDSDVSEQQLDRANALLRFAPFPEVERVIFVAAPHRGTVVAGQRLARWMSGFIRLPRTVVEGIVQNVLPGATAADHQRLELMPNSVHNLDQNDSFIRAAADLPISADVHYHSIIAQADPRVTLEDSDDGLVPYRSAHLPAAVSEKVIVSGHSVQQNAAAIMEIQRILQEDARWPEAAASLDPEAL